MLGALTGYDADLAGFLPSGGIPRGLVGGAVIGAAAGILLSILHVRSEVKSAARQPTYVWPMLVGTLTLLLSGASFVVASQLVPGVRPLVVASAPIDLTRPGYVTLRFTSDSTAPYGVELALGVDRVAKTIQQLGLQGKQKSVEQPLPPAAAVQWSSDVPGAKSGSVERVFDTADSRLAGLGTLNAEQGRTYTLTATVITPFPSAQAAKPRFEVHRTMVGWGRYFPRMLVAGVLGLLEGIAGMMLVVYGGVLRYNRQHSEKPVDDK